MTAAELASAYPAIPYAVSYVEEVVSKRAPGKAESAWEHLAGRGLAPIEMVDVLTTICEEQEATFGDVEPKLAAALTEMAHPQFLHYIRGRMGAV